MYQLRYEPQETAGIDCSYSSNSKDFGITIILIEHDMSLVMDVTGAYSMFWNTDAWLQKEHLMKLKKNNKRVIGSLLGRWSIMAMLKVERSLNKYGSIGAAKNVSF